MDDGIRFYSFKFVNNSNGGNKHKFRNLMRTGLGSSQDLNEYRKMKKMQEVYAYEQHRRTQTPITFYGNVQNNINNTPLFFDQPVQQIEPTVQSVLTPREQEYNLDDYETDKMFDMGTNVDYIISKMTYKKYNHLLTKNHPVYFGYNIEVPKNRDFFLDFGLRQRFKYNYYKLELSIHGDYVDEIYKTVLTNPDFKRLIKFSSSMFKNITILLMSKKSVYNSVITIDNFSLFKVMDKAMDNNNNIEVLTDKIFDNVTDDDKFKSIFDDLNRIFDPDNVNIDVDVNDELVKCSINLKKETEKKLSKILCYQFDFKNDRYHESGTLLSTSSNKLSVYNAKNTYGHTKFNLDLPEEGTYFLNYKLDNKSQEKKDMEVIVSDLHYNNLSVGSSDSGIFFKSGKEEVDVILYFKTKDNISVNFDYIKLYFLDTNKCQDLNLNVIDINGVKKVKNEKYIIEKPVMELKLTEVYSCKFEEWNNSQSLFVNSYIEKFNNREQTVILKSENEGSNGYMTRKIDYTNNNGTLLVEFEGYIIGNITGHLVFTEGSNVITKKRIETKSSRGNKIQMTLPVNGESNIRVGLFMTYNNIESKFSGIVLKQIKVNKVERIPQKIKKYIEKKMNKKFEINIETETESEEEELDSSDDLSTDGKNQTQFSDYL